MTEKSHAKPQSRKGLRRFPERRDLRLFPGLGFLNGFALFSLNSFNSSNFSPLEIAPPRLKLTLIADTY